MARETPEVVSQPSGGVANRSASELANAAKALVDGITFQPPEFAHKRTREELHALIDELAMRAAAAPARKTAARKKSLPAI